jgi:hypothetical protein
VQQGPLGDVYSTYADHLPKVCSDPFTNCIMLIGF